MARSWSSSSYRSRQRPTTPYDADTTTSRTISCARDALGDGSARPPDPRAQLEDVDGAHDLTEDAHHSGRRVDLGRAQLHQRGLAGTVGAEDHPALVLLDRPVDTVQQGGTASLDGDVGELEHGIHVWDLSGASGSVETHINLPAATDVAAPAYAPAMGSLPVAAVLATWLDACRAGDVGPDDLADAVRGDDPRHLVSGLGDGTGADVLELHELPAALEGPVSLALPGARRPGGPRRSGRVQRRGDRGRSGRRRRCRRAGAVGGRADGRVAGPSSGPGAVGGRAGDGHRAAHDARRGDQTPGRPRRGLVAAGIPTC